MEKERSKEIEEEVKVLIKDNCEEIMPEYLDFVKACSNSSASGFLCCLPHVFRG